MHKYVFHNKQIQPLNEVCLSPGQAGLMSGWGIFTTLRIYDRRPFAYERHWRRLATDARRTNVPFDYHERHISEKLQELIHANRVIDGLARIYVIYNRFGIWCSDESLPESDLLICTTDLVKREGAVRLGVMPHGRLAANQLAGTKVTSWLPNVWSLEQAHRQGFEEVILLNERGEVAECTAANLFVVQGEGVETPPLSSGCLAGVTREILLEICGSVGVRAVERTVMPKDLNNATEVFLTSTTRHVQAVSHIEQHAVPRAPGPITLRLAEAFAKYVERYFASTPGHSR